MVIRVNRIGANTIHVHRDEVNKILLGDEIQNGAVVPELPEDGIYWAWDNGIFINFNDEDKSYIEVEQ